MKARAAEIATVTVLSSLSVAYCLFYYYLNDDGYSIYSGQLGFLHVLVCIPVIRFSLAWIVGLAISGKVIGAGRLTKIHVAIRIWLLRYVLDAPSLFHIYRHPVAPRFSWP